VSIRGKVFAKMSDFDRLWYKSSFVYAVLCESRIFAKIFSRRGAESAEKGEKEWKLMLLSASSAPLREPFPWGRFDCG
jgi:hypothetical protein